MAVEDAAEVGPGARGGDRLGAYRYVKRALDVGASIVVCAVAAVPVAIACAAITAESHGSPIFRHERVGVGGRPFGMLKLRTMYADAEAHMGKYLTQEQMEEWRTEHKVENDPRITHVGRVLRRTSLDELPQFINVLVGDMSVVGPRPVTEGELHWYGDAADEILSVRPGITGYWQAYARNDATWESGERQAMELHYIRNFSPLLDAKIFLRTFSVVCSLTGK